ncbi:MAG: hypothetical protein AAB916_00705 [Patescibacteria group bacterium]
MAKKKRGNKKTDGVKPKNNNSYTAKNIYVLEGLGREEVAENSP